MKAPRLRLLERGQTSIAKKVLSCIPLQEIWGHHQILDEIARSGSRMDVRIFDGCIAALLDAKLIREPHRRNYQRVGPSEPDEVEHQQEEEEAPVATPAPQLGPIPNADPLVRLGRLAEKLRGLADEIDDAALSIDAMKNANAAELEVIKQFKLLMGKV